MKKGACSWCNAIVAVDDNFDLKSKTRDCVCSHDCAVKERNFRVYFSDENVGLRNYRDHGINPNQRGNHGKNKST